MRSRASHQLDEVPVFFCRIAITLYITDYFRIDFASCIEPKRCFNHFIFQVTVNSFRTSDNLDSSIDFFIIFG